MSTVRLLFFINYAFNFLNIIPIEYEIKKVHVHFIVFAESVWYNLPMQFSDECKGCLFNSQLKKAEREQADKVKLK